ncbi:hypothetical protein L484_026059 [Morus notabilis]|uniref:Uncharacterized protein n=1 Tax=Morus notabilis TaxID=981085 RepID=W9RIH4_9ROSA|nr:hypothetical protein L484_026059 [Morus notabilis]
MNEQQSSSRSSADRQNVALLVLNSIFLSIGNCGGPLIMRPPMTTFTPTSTSRASASPPPPTSSPPSSPAPPPSQAKVHVVLNTLRRFADDRRRSLGATH